MSVTTILIALASVMVVAWTWRVLNWVWLRPKKLERCLRQQGLSGNPYRLLFGDTRENLQMIKEAKSKPINLSDDIVPRLIPFIHRSVQNYGKNSFIWMGPIPRLNIVDPELIKEILIKFSNFQKAHTNPLSKVLVSGLPSQDGEKWAKHRKIINPAFQLEKLKHMLPAFYLSCSEVMGKWEKMVSVEGTCELDVWPSFENLAGDVISRTAFGSNYEEGRMIFQLQEELAELTVQVRQSVYIPGWRFIPTKVNNRMMKIEKELRALLSGIINKRVKAMEAGESATDDLLGILLESNLKQIQEYEGNKNFGLSIKEVIDECKSFYFAGQETTAGLLAWTMMLLSVHPNWQALAREEVLQVFGNDKPDLDGLNRLKVVTMILYEVLRLYPPAVLLTRTIHKDTKLGEMLLPSGVELSLLTILVHHDKEIWGDDAKEFKPERFSDGVSKATKGQFSYFPFSWGPRICIGQNFAMMEVKLALTMILQRFSFELSPSYVHGPLTVLILKPQYGVHLILRKP